MSLDVYLQVFDKGEATGIPRDSVRDAVGAVFVTETASGSWRVQYDAENSCDVYLNVDAGAGMLQGLSINRPCGDMRLWQALATILRLGNVVLYFPGCKAPLIANLNARQHLPLDMIEALGEPMILTSGAEILREIQAV
jgi:hypothetical protein